MVHQESRSITKLGLDLAARKLPTAPHGRARPAVDGGLLQAWGEPGFELEPTLRPEPAGYRLTLFGRKVAEPARKVGGEVHQLIDEAPVGRREGRRVVAVDDVDLLGVPVCEQRRPLERALTTADYQNSPSPQLVKPDHGTRVRLALRGQALLNPLRNDGKVSYAGGATTVSALTRRPLWSVTSKLPLGLERSWTRSGSTPMPAFSWNHSAYSMNSPTGMGSMSAGSIPCSSR